MKIATDLGSNSATLGNGIPDAKMQSHLTPASPEPKTVGSQVPAPVATNVDSWTLEGSHAGDARSDAQGNTSPLRGNDTAPRSPADNTEGTGA